MAASPSDRDHVERRQQEQLLKLVTKGFYTWQYLFADATLPEKEAGYVTERMRLMLDFLPPRFPDYDYSPLEARLKAWPGSTS